MRKATKTIISLAVILIAGLTFVVPAYAQDPFTAVAVGVGGASGAGLFGAVGSAMGIDTASTNQNTLDSWWYKSGSPDITISGVRHKGTGQADDPYDYIIVDSTSWANIRNYVNANTTYYELTDNDSEIFQTNKNYRGYPFTTQTNTGYTVGPSLGTLYLNQTYIVGSASADTNTTTTDRFLFQAYYQGQSTGNANWYNQSLIPYNTLYLGIYNNSTYWMRFNGTEYSLMIPTGIPSTQITQPTNLTVTTGEIDPFWGDDFLSGAKISIASTPDLSPQFTAEDFLQTLSEYIATNGSLGSGITVEDASPPVPPTPVPVPDTPLGEVPFDDWVDLWGQGIYEQLENQSDALDFIGSNGTDAIEELESIDENIGALEETAESIDTNIGIGNGILGGISSLAQSAVDYLEGIAEHVGELVEEIVEGTETLIAGILNQIPQAFGVIFGPIKQASSIWHYVVEWIQSIGAPFQFIWSMASGTSYYVILPVYASLAAAVVLAFFKRFGR